MMKIVSQIFIIWLQLYLGECGLREDIFAQDCPNDLNYRRFQYELVHLETPIVFYKRSYSSAYVNSAGLISFNDKVSGFYKHSFGINLTTQYSFPVLTPLWSRFPDSGPPIVCYWNITDSTIIGKYRDLLELKDGFREFQPSLLLVATWNNGTVSGSNELTTFAVIVATDGKLSFSQFLYQSIAEGTEYVTGFSAGDKNNSLVLIRGNGSLSQQLKQRFELAYRLDGDCIAPATSACNVTSFPTSCTPPPNISVSCACNEGYHNINTVDEMCEDINECDGEPPCGNQSICVNSKGSYNCTCLKGFNKNNDSYCTDTDECVEIENICGGDGDCLNTFGSFMCCSNGFSANTTGEECIDIDECNEGIHSCTSSEMCFNTEGDYVCCSSNEAFNENKCQALPEGFPTALTVGLVIAIFFLMILMGVLVIIIIKVVVTKRKKTTGKKMLFIPEGGSHEYIDEMSEISSPNFHHAGSMIKLFELPRVLKIPFEDLEIEAKMIGEGEFGIVYRAKYQDKSVAVKVLKGVSGTIEVRQVVEEIMKMKDFSHPNILSLIGVSIDHHFSPCIIMPFMWNGSLDNFLRKEENKEKYFITLETVGKDTEVDDAARKLLDMCFQIAKGMTYLSNEKIVHRDLAARNCMVSMNNVIKVADFGLSITLAEDKDYFRLSDSRSEKLPWKWMAIETLTEHKFSEASDVWSFGITCWEVFNGGGKPYPGIGNRGIMEEVLAGYRMAKPPNKACKESIYEIMYSCWEKEPTDRPTFSDLVIQLSSLLHNMNEYLPLIGEKQEANCEEKHLDLQELPDNEKTSIESEK